MDEKENEFLKKLLATFKVEADEHLRAIASGLIDLEQASGGEKEPGSLETVFREVHSLKGAARSVSQEKIERVCQGLESVFAAAKKGEIRLTPAAFDLFHETVNVLLELLSRMESGGPTPPGSEPDIKKLLQNLESLRTGASAPPEAEQPRPAAPDPKPVPQGETVRITAGKLEALLFQSEELLSAKSLAARHAEQIKETHRLLTAWESAFAKVYPEFRTLRGMAEKNAEGKRNGGARGQIGNLLNFVEWSRDFMRSVEDHLYRIAREAEHNWRNLDRMVDRLLEDMKKALMLPCASLLQVFPRMVRDLSHESGKAVHLEIVGDDCEVDRRILERIREPLIHLVRNAVDHGIEKPEERVRTGKAEEGKLILTVAQKEGNKIEILVSDDGAGIDPEKVVASALKSALISPEEAERMTEQEKLSLIFLSGFSTSPLITKLSGRGLGLPIVREAVEQLGGTLSVETKAGKGTTFRLLLPLTLSTFRAVLVKAGGSFFFIPSTGVIRIVRAGPDEIRTVENRETLELQGKATSLARLTDVLGVPEKKNPEEKNDKLPALVLGSDDTRIAFLVDQVLGEHEILVKTLGKQLSRIRNFTGAAILADGKIVPIVNIPDLFRSAVGSAVPARAAGPPEESGERKSILVAEDSITSRTLLCGILESAGYRVRGAIDGMEALAMLKTEKFDLLVSDVDMPRMNGFDLTARVRADKKLADLPVVLVTALESREDRERGIDVGANAYIVKSSFDQSNLLEVVERLISWSDS